MSWGAAFLSAIAAPAPGRLAVLIEGFDPGPDWQTAAWIVSSHLGLPGAQILCRGGWQQAGARIAPRSWAASVGSLAFRIARDPDVLRRMARGQLVRVRVGPVGWPAGALEVVGVYQLWSLQSQRAGVDVVCRDLLGALASRLSTDTDKISLFQDLTTTGPTTTASYSPGAGSLTVSSTTLFRRQDDGGGALRGAVRITDGSTSFIRFWTAKTPTVLTVDTASYNLNEPDSAASSGAGVAEVAFLDDHPLTAVRRILLSSGTTGFRGDYDTLPETWGYALPRWAVDEADLAEGAARTQPASGSADWTIYAEESQADGIAWIESWLCQGGYALTARQGALTARPILAPTAKIAAWVLDDREIVEVIAWEAWDPSGSEAAALSVRGATGSGGVAEQTAIEAPATLPAEAEALLDVGVFVSENAAAIRVEIRNRVAIWYQRTPERLRIRLGGLRLAAAAPGDLAELTSRVLRGRTGAYLRTRALIVEVAPDWLGGWVTLELLIAPEAAGLFA